MKAIFFIMALGIGYNAFAVDKTADRKPNAVQRGPFIFVDVQPSTSNNAYGGEYGRYEFSDWRYLAEAMSEQCDKLKSFNVIENYRDSVEPKTPGEKTKVYSVLCVRK